MTRRDCPKSRRRCDARFESALARRGFVAIAGLDEAGRGCLFGPVFASAVILPLAAQIDGVNDSKQLTPAARQRLAAQVEETASCWALGRADAVEIDRINIYQASRLAMKRAVSALSIPPDFLLVDALQVDVPVAQRALIKGDARSRTIAAASILAKVHRDACMLEWDLLYPQYGLARNKGYGSPDHLAALERFGPTPQHRFTFAPVRRFLPSGQLDFTPADRGGRSAG